MFKRIWVIRQVSRCFLPLPRFIRIMVSSWCQKLVRLTALWDHMMIIIMISQGHQPTCSCTAHAREASSSYICRHLIYHHLHHDQWPQCSGCQKLVRLVAPQHKRMYYKRQCWVQLTIVSAWRIFANGKEYFACPNCQLARGWGFHVSWEITKSFILPVIIYWRSHATLLKWFCTFENILVSLKRFFW